MKLQNIKKKVYKNSQRLRVGAYKATIITLRKKSQQQSEDSLHKVLRENKYKTKIVFFAKPSFRNETKS